MGLMELAAIVTAIAVPVGGAWAMLKVIVAQFEKRLDERFNALEKARQAGRSRLDERLAAIEQSYHALERELLSLKADMPVHYVRREDAIRSETVINAKLDALAAKIDLVADRQKQG